MIFSRVLIESLYAVLLKSSKINAVFQNTLESWIFQQGFFNMLWVHTELNVISHVCWFLFLVLVLNTKSSNTWNSNREILLNIDAMYSVFGNNFFGLIPLSRFQAKATVFLLLTLVQKSSWNLKVYSGISAQLKICEL